MRPKTEKLLHDVLDAASFVQKVTGGKTLDDYRGDRLLRQAVERNFEIIGEAVGKVAKDDPKSANQIDGYQQIIAFRNLLIHGYDLIDDAHVWDVIKNDLPTLESQVGSVLDDG